MAGTPLAEAFVRVRALTSDFKDDVEKGFRGVGPQVGRQFGQQFSDAAAPAFRDVGRKFFDAAGPAFKDLGQQAEAGMAKAAEAIRKYEGQLAQAELAARRTGLASTEAAERAEAASKRAAEAAEQAAKGELSKEEATRLAAAAAREQEKAEIAATAAQLAKVKVNEQAAQVSQAYARAQSQASQETDKSTGAFGRNGSAMSRLLGAARGLGETFTGLGVGMASFAAKAGLGAAALAGLGAAAASAAGYTVALAAALAPVGGLLAALPGVALTGAAAFSVWKLATSGLADAMSAVLSGNLEAMAAAMSKLTDRGREFVREFEQLLPQFNQFKALAQDPFLEPIIGQMGRWLTSARALGPAIGGLAGEFGQLVRTVLDFATAPDTIARFNVVLGNTQTLVGALRTALDPLLSGFVALGTVGSSWLAGMSGGLTESLTKFGEWMTRVAESGEALRWMDNALVVLKQLGGLVKDLWSIFDGFMDAARTAGGDVLGVLGQLVDGFAKWVQSAEGQDVLVTIFEALNDVGKALLPVVKSLAGAIAEIAPEAAKVATALGPVLAEAITMLGKGIAAMGPGLVKMVEAFGRMLTSMGPLEPLGAAIGQIFAELGGALALIVPELAKIALALAPALAAALKALGPALAALSPGLVAIAENLGKAFASPEMQRGLLALGKGIADILVAAAPLLPVIAQLAGILAQVLGGALTNLGVLLGPIIAALGAALEPALRAVSNALNLLIPLMEPVLKAFGEIGAAVITQVLPPLINLIPALIDSLIPAFAQLLTQLTPLIPMLADLAVKFINEILPAVLPMIPQLTELSLVLAKIGIVAAQLVTDLAPYITKMISEFQRLIDRAGEIIGWFGKLPETMRMWLGQVVDWVQNKWALIKNYIAMKIDEIKTKIRDTLDAIKQKWHDIWDGLKTFVSDKWNEIKTAVSGKISDVLETIRGIPGRITGALGNLGSLLWDSGRSIIQGLIDGLWSKLQDAYNAASEILGRIRSLFPFSPAKEGPFSGKGWTLYSGRSLVAGLAQGVLQEQDALTSAVDQVLRAGAGVLAPALPGFDVPSPAPAFGGGFGVPAPGGVGAVAAPRVVNVENLIVQGVFDPSNPIGYRRMVEGLRSAIIDLEQEGYVNG